jgi:uncharacterized protein YbjT (DUF2867 family)
VKAAVLGATGFIGRALVPSLAERMDVVAISRRGDAAEAARVHPVAADARDARSLQRPFAGVDVVYYLVHSLGQANFGDVDRRAAANVADQAARAGVKQIVFLGGLGDEEANLSEHLRSRVETARVLAAGSVPVTKLGAAVVVGRGSAAFDTIVALVDRLPVMIAPRWVSMPTQPIALADVVAFLREVGGLPAALGQTFDLGGPDVLTYREMIERVGELRGRRPRILEVPVLTPRLSSYWLHLVTPVRVSVARPLVEGLRNPTVAADTRIRELVPRKLVPFDEAVRQALAVGA